MISTLTNQTFNKCRAAGAAPRTPRAHDRAAGGAGVYAGSPALESVGVVGLAGWQAGRRPEGMQSPDLHNLEV